MLKLERYGHGQPKNYKSETEAAAAARVAIAENSDRLNDRGRLEPGHTYDGKSPCGRCWQEYCRCGASVSIGPMPGGGFSPVISAGGTGTTEKYVLVEV